MKPLLISSGEPAGVGPDLCIALAEYDLPIVVLGDQQVLEERAKKLNKSVRFVTYKLEQPIVSKVGCLTVLPLDCPAPVVTGKLNVQNANYVLDLLTLAAKKTAQGEFSGLVTAPVHKAIINQANKPFTGHTEFLAELLDVETVVMMLACQEMKVALVTTHLPLCQVPDAISSVLVQQVITKLHKSLLEDFAMKQPLIKVAGLNPHAGESGYLGREEIDIISPALAILRNQGINVEGPLPADTLFTKNHMQECAAFVCMYHDQGLPVLKYAGFNRAVNITLGLPIIRTSVDHGTALDLAGTGLVDSGSMLEAVYTAKNMAMNRIKNDTN